jgi:hypothetical protein
MAAPTIARLASMPGSSLGSGSALVDAGLLE